MLCIELYLCQSKCRKAEAKDYMPIQGNSGVAVSLWERRDAQNVKMGIWKNLFLA
jgi:hypothetical protein